MHGYSWLNLSLDWQSKKRMVNLSEEMDRTLNEGWYTGLICTEVHTDFAKLTDKYGSYYVLSVSKSNLVLDCIVDGMVKTLGNCQILRDGMGRLWVNTVPDQDMHGPYKTIDQAKAFIKDKGWYVQRRRLTFYQVYEDGKPKQRTKKNALHNNPTHPK